MEPLAPLVSGDGAVCFRALLVYEIAGRREQALSALEAALAAGYPLNEIRRDPELAKLRKDPRYHLLITPVENRRSS